MRIDDGEWQALATDTQEFQQIHRLLFHAFPDDNANRPAIATRILPCYGDVILVRVEGGAAPVFALLGPGYLRYVSGEPEDIYTTNLRHAPDLGDAAKAAEYLSLVIELTRDAQGGRWVVEPGHLVWRDGERPDAAAPIEQHLAPMRIGGPDEHGRFEAKAVFQIAGALVQRDFVLWPNGVVQIRGDTVLIEDEFLAAPPPLAPFSSLLGSPFARTPDSGAVEAAATLTGTIDAPAAPAAGKTPSKAAEPPKSAPPRRLDELFRLLSGVLLDEALLRHEKLDSVAAARRRFFGHVGAFRPTIAIETPYRDLRRDLARLFAEALQLPLNMSFETAGDPMRAGMTRHPGPQPEIVLLTEASFNKASENPSSDAWSMLEPIARGPHVALFIVESLARLPQDARDLIDIQFTIPRMGPDLFWACTKALMGNRVRQPQARLDWVQYVLPRDMVRTATATRSLKAYLAELEQKITGRLTRYTVPSALTLAEVEGTGEARLALQELAADISDAVAGKIAWDKVDRGLLLYGPPGSGKTTLVRALARESGIRFILASASAWQEAPNLGPHLQRIRDTFREARLYAPCILFIDEIDSIGSRSRVEEQNNHYQTVVINTVLEELQGFEGRDGVIAIAATNNLDSVDPALRRPGRFDRTVEVPFPNVAALALIYRSYLTRLAHDGLTLDEIDTGHLARLTFGGSGAHVELYVRGAARRARRLDRARVTQQDLVDEITNRPRDGRAITLDPEGMRRVAVHEAGHALVSLTGPARGREISMISIVPRTDGRLGFVARAPDEQYYATRDQMEEQIRIMLGGRAAEEMVYGRSEVSMGAGGGIGSDIARATQFLLRLLTEFGLSDSSGLLWIDWHATGSGYAVTAEAIRNLPIGSEILTEARRTLDRLYAEAMERLIFHRAALERIVTLLIEKQEITSEALQGVVEGQAVVVGAVGD